MGEGKEHIAAKFLQYTSLTRVEVRSPRDRIYWRRNLSTMSDFVEGQRDETLEIAEAGLV